MAANAVLTLTPEQAAKLHTLITALDKGITEVLPAGVQTESEPGATLAHLRFYCEEARCYLGPFMPAEQRTS